MAGVTEDVLSRTLRIVQHAKGHRAASDDVLLAWAAAEAHTGAERILDLGSGKGTVALLLCRRLPLATVVGVEAEPAHHELAVRNAALNGLERRYRPTLGDLRSVTLAPEFDLVCGAPPFMRPGSGVLPRNPLRAAARFELRGGVEAYAQAGARALAPGGRLVLLMDGQGGRRAVQAVEAAGLVVERRITVRPRPGRAATYEIVQSARPGDVSPIRGGPHLTHPCVNHSEIVMRGGGEDWSPAYAAVRRALDLP